MAEPKITVAMMARWTDYGPLASRPQRDTRNPCRVCGWSAHMAIHSPGSKPGTLFHAYVPLKPEGATHD